MQYQILEMRVSWPTFQRRILQMHFRMLRILRATNGAQQSRVDASFDLMRVQITSKRLAYSAIMDVDIARTRLI